MFTFKPGHINMIGPPGSGKSSLCIKLIENKNTVFEHPPEKIHIFYEKWQPLYENLSGVEFVQGMPDTLPDSDRQLLIFDDVADFCENSFELYRQICVHSRHTKSYTIGCKHNLFSKSKFSHDLNLATQYFVLFDTPNLSQISHLGRQFFPGKLRYFLDSYKKSCQRYFYLLVDLTPRQTDRLLSDVLASSPAIFVEM